MVDLYIRGLPQASKDDVEFEVGDVDSMNCEILNCRRKASAGVIYEHLGVGVESVRPRPCWKSGIGGTHGVTLHPLLSLSPSRQEGEAE